MNIDRPFKALVHHGDVVAALRLLPDNSVDAIVTDPPYGLEFMGKEWDSFGDAKFTKPGLGDRDTAWPSFGGDPLQGTNPTCAICGGRARGAKRCACETPHWRVKGQPIGKVTGAVPQSGARPVSDEKGAHDEGYRNMRGFEQAFQAWCLTWTVEALRVLKPGGHLLAFGGTRTYHRLACAIEDAGFEIRDSIDWIYGSGFPKSRDIAKDIDKQAGAERAIIGMQRAPGHAAANVEQGAQGRSTLDFPKYDATPATDDARTWNGWGTALKPAHEPIVVARKPLIGTVAANVLQHGTGALNIDACRVASPGETIEQHGRLGSPRLIFNGDVDVEAPRERGQSEGQALGRWPANVVLTHAADCVRVGMQKVKAITGTAAGRMAGNNDTPVYGGGYAGSTNAGAPTGYGGMEDVAVYDCAPDCPVAEMDRQSGARTSGVPGFRQKEHETTAMAGSLGGARDVRETGYGDTGGASRFFNVTEWEDEAEDPLWAHPGFVYHAKASRKDREAGAPPPADGQKRGNTHPTVKPRALMAHLVKLVTPPGGLVCDPFLGSGTTGMAAIEHGFRFIGIDKTAEYITLSRARLAWMIARTKKEKA